MCIIHLQRITLFLHLPYRKIKITKLGSWNYLHLPYGEDKNDIETDEKTNKIRLHLPYQKDKNSTMKPELIRAINLHLPY